MNISKSIKDVARNMPGWHTQRKIVVIESDDWGSIRMESKAAYDFFLRRGFKVNECPYSKYDALEDDDDLQMLIDVLNEVRDSIGNYAKFTINNVVANPDFNKIKSSDFLQYAYEPFTTTLERFPNRSRVMRLYRESINAGILQPQFHGREHINVSRWLNLLRGGHDTTRLAFEYNMFTVHKSGDVAGRRDALDTFGRKSIINTDVSFHESIKEGLDLFRTTWGFESKSFIAPCYVWHPNIEPILFRNGVEYIQGTHVQRIPKDDHSIEIKKRYHFTGQRNRLGQIYLVRNVFFEPVTSSPAFALQQALKEIRLAFKMRKPAIISSHRVNYIGSLCPQNRRNNLKALKDLLTTIRKNWPDVEFMSSDELGDLIKNR